MLFPEQYAPLLKAWIVKRLETPSGTESDVDADVLADYVLALLRHDGDTTDIKKLCVTELHDFLKDEAEPFINAVFQALSYQSYLPGARPPPPIPPPAHSIDQPKLSLSPTITITQTANSGTGFGPLNQPVGAAPGLDHGPNHYHAQSNGSRKRPYKADVPDANVAEGAHPHARPGERPIKQPRRGGVFRGGQGAGRGMPTGANAIMGMPLPSFSPGTSLPVSGLPVYPGKVPPRDGNAFGSLVPPSIEEILQMQQQLGLPIPMFKGYGAVSPGKQSKSSRRQRRCRYLEKKGFCSRANCPFDHSEPADLNSMDPASLLQFQQGMFPMFPQLLPQFPEQQQQQFGGSHQSKNRPRRGEKAHFSADGPIYDQNKSTIVVEGIPDEFLNEAEVKGFFSQFGSIVSIKVQVPQKLAIVKFESWEQANAAYQSPKVIFDNRFVKVFWYKDEPKHSNASGRNHGEDGKELDEDARDDVTLQKLIREQEEAQRLYEEKVQKKKKLDEQREALDQRMKSLLAKHAEERRKLVSIMASMAAKRSRKNGGDTSEAESASTAEGSDNKLAALTKTEIIRAQLTALEEEARMLGIDPDAITLESGLEDGMNSNADKSPAYASWAPRGGSHVRGRGGFPYRGRGGGYAARGGSSGAIASAYAAYSLDNRPKKVAVAGVDFAAPDNDEALRQYLLGVGDFDTIDKTGGTATITFTDRRTAEKFYYGLPRAKGIKESSGEKNTQGTSREIPGIDSPVELSWVAGTVGSFTGNSSRPQAPAQTNKGRHSTAANGVEDGEGAFMGMGEGEERGQGVGTEDGEVEEHKPRLHRQNMDFDVAGDGDWDIA